MTLGEPTELVDRVFGDRYRVVAGIGAAAVSEVVVAHDEQTGARVALKVFDQSLGEDPDVADRVVASIEAAAELDHANLLDISDWGVDGVRIWMVTELCRGGSLRSMLATGQRLTPSQALVMALECARGLAHAHAAGYVHGRLTPENILFTEDQRLRIADFGLDWIAAQAPVSRGASAVDLVRYHSPEQARGRNVTERSDLFALALVVREAVTGRGPAVADTVVGTLMARAETVVELEPDLGALRSPLERCARLDAAERPDAEELTIALLAAAETMPRPGGLPLAGVAGADALPEPMPTDVEVDVVVPGFEAPVELTAVPDIAERSGLEDLDAAEPVFATEEPDAPIDTPVAPTRSASPQLPTER